MNSITIPTIDRRFCLHKACLKATSSRGDKKLQNDVNKAAHLVKMMLLWAFEYDVYDPKEKFAGQQDRVIFFLLVATAPSEICDHVTRVRKAVIPMVEGKWFRNEDRWQKNLYRINRACILYNACAMVTGLLSDWNDHLRIMEMDHLVHFILNWACLAGVYSPSHDYKNQEGTVHEFLFSENLPLDVKEKIFRLRSILGQLIKENEFRRACLKENYRLKRQHVAENNNCNVENSFRNTECIAGERNEGKNKNTLGNGNSKGEKNNCNVENSFRNTECIDVESNEDKNDVVPQDQNTNGNGNSKGDSDSFDRCCCEIGSVDCLSLRHWDDNSISDNMEDVETDGQKSLSSNEYGDSLSKDSDISLESSRSSCEFETSSIVSLSMLFEDNHDITHELQFSNTNSLERECDSLDVLQETIQLISMVIPNLESKRNFEEKVMSNVMAPVAANYPADAGMEDGPQGG